jgi:hypothetical protein
VIEDRARDQRLHELLQQYHSSRKNRIIVFVLYKKEAVRVESLLARKGWKVGGWVGGWSPCWRARHGRWVRAWVGGWGFGGWGAPLRGPSAPAGRTTHQKQHIAPVVRPCLLPAGRGHPRRHAAQTRADHTLEASMPLITLTTPLSLCLLPAGRGHPRRH